MAGRFLPKFIWHCKQIAASLGITGGATAVLIIGGITFYFFAVIPLEKSITSLQQKTEQLRAQVQSRKAANMQLLAPAEQLVSFYKIFPNASSAPDNLNKIYEAAKAHSLALEQGEYRMSRDENSKLVRYEIIFPVKGTYPQIRKFVNQVLKNIPTIALENITFQRQKVGESTIQSQIRFMLYLGEGR